IRTRSCARGRAVATSPPRRGSCITRATPARDRAPWSRSATSSRASAAQREGAPRRPLSKPYRRVRLGRGARWLGGGARARRRGGGGVLELLLRAEQGVKHLLAEPLGQHQGRADADEQEHHAPLPPALALGLGAAQGVGRAAKRGRRLPELPLRLLV